ncbi:dehydratase [Salicibibacter halophilus]|uniref:Dehydratase n=1 Tax=Salicibibacter halophilus TaxID=2502791 RepID=A0A514LF68_9BACI|nr:MaoC/PaaZ C-terminal domain-containing protein [Salicibibacter halophilus]QDI90498.1 dehydratase [Salicibibacter halophilus]
MSAIAEKQTGDTLETVTLSPVSRLDLIKYAGASGDYNPIHTIDEEADKAGLPGIIAHGMWTMGNLAKLFTPHYEAGFIETYQIRFRGMVFLGDVISLNAEVSEQTADKVILDVLASNEKHEAVLKGTVVFALYA